MSTGEVIDLISGHLEVDDPARFPIGMDGYGFPLINYQRRWQDSVVAPVRSAGLDIDTLEKVCYWEQDDYTGGGYQDHADDPEMVYRCWGSVPSQRKKSTRAVPYLIKRHTLSMGAGENPFKLLVQGETVCAVATTRLTVYRETVAGVQTTGTVAFASSAKYATIDRSATQVVVGHTDGVLRRYAVATGALASSTPAVDEKGNAISGSLNLVEFFGESLFGVFGRVCYRLSDAGKWVRVGTTKNPSRGALPAPPIDAVAYNGQLYILCGNDKMEGFVCVTTGSDVQTVVDIPFAVEPKRLATYAGRLYIGATGYDLDGVDRFGELYEFTGNSLRLVRTFSPDYQGLVGQTAAPNWDADAIYPRTLGALGVQEGLLWYPANRGDALVLGAYDRSTDGFFSSGPLVSLFTPGGAGTWTLCSSGSITAIAAVRDRLCCWVSSADGVKRGFYQTQEGNWVASTNATYPLGWEPLGLTETSWFSVRPERTKRFLDLCIRHQGLQGAVRGVQYSTDGTTWTSLTRDSITQAGGVWTGRYKVNVGGNAIKFRIRHDPINVELRGHSLSYVWGWGANVAKRAWQISVPLSSVPVELLDGSQTWPVTTLADVRDGLWKLAESGKPFDFRDRNGVTYRVIAASPFETAGLLNAGLEGTMSLYLVEVPS